MRGVVGLRGATEGERELGVEKSAPGHSPLSIVIPVTITPLPGDAVGSRMEGEPWGEKSGSIEAAQLHTYPDPASLAEAGAYWEYHESEHIHPVEEQEGSCETNDTPQTSLGADRELLNLHGREVSRGPPETLKSNDCKGGCHL